MPESDTPITDRASANSAKNPDIDDMRALERLLNEAERLLAIDVPPLGCECDFCHWATRLAAMREGK